LRGGEGKNATWSLTTPQIENDPYGDYHADLSIGPRRGGMALSRLRVHAKQLRIACNIGVVTDDLVRRGDPRGHQYTLKIDGEKLLFDSPNALKEHLKTMAAALAENDEPGPGRAQ